MSKGFMVIDRERLSDWQWLSDKNVYYAFTRMLFDANFEIKLWRNIVIERGQFVCGIDRYAAELGFSTQSLRTIIQKLKRSGDIDVKATNKFTIITICNYDSWCCKTCNDSDGSNEQSNNPATINQQTTNDNLIIELKKRIEQLEKEKDCLIAEKKKEKNNKKEKDEKFEECWLAYNRKGSKAKAFEYWNKLSDADKALVLPHIKVYVSTRERVYQKDFERYLRDKIFKTIIVKGNDTIYDPEQFTNKEEYRPITDGVFQIWNPERKCLLFNGFIDQLNDGYTADTRPDGARVAWQMYEWVWSSRTKEWIKQND